MQQLTIDEHLQQALSHLESAIGQSVALIHEDEGRKKEIGRKWEGFLGDFYGHAREKGKQSRINLLGLISFPRIR